LHFQKILITEIILGNGKNISGGFSINVDVLIENKKNDNKPPFRRLWV
jgi:hypothetical protein